MDKYKADYRFCCDLLAEERSRFYRGLAERLLSEKRILVKDLTGKKGLPAGEYLRLAVRDSKDNDKLLDGLKEFCDQSQA